MGSGSQCLGANPCPQAGYVDDVTGQRVKKAGFLQAPSFCKRSLSIYLILESALDAEDTRNMIRGGTPQNPGIYL